MNIETDQRCLGPQHPEWGAGGWEFHFGNIKCERTNRHPSGGGKYMKKLRSQPSDTRLSPERPSYSLNHKRFRHVPISPRMFHWHSTSSMSGTRHILFFGNLASFLSLLFQIISVLDPMDGLGSSSFLSVQVNPPSSSDHTFVIAIPKALPFLLHRLLLWSSPIPPGFLYI